MTQVSFQQPRELSEFVHSQHFTATTLSFSWSFAIQSTSKRTFSSFSGGLAVPYNPSVRVGAHCHFTVDPSPVLGKIVVHGAGDWRTKKSVTSQDLKLLVKLLKFIEKFVFPVGKTKYFFSIMDTFCTRSTRTFGYKIQQFFFFFTCALLSLLKVCASSTYSQTCFSNSIETVLLTKFPTRNFSYKCTESGNIEVSIMRG